MEATLSLHHHLSPKSLMAASLTTKYSTSTNPRALTTFTPHPPSASLFSGIHLGVTRVQLHPPKPQHDLVLKCSSAFGDHMDICSADREKMPKRRVERSPSTRSLSLAPLRSGRVVLEGISDAKRALLDPKLLDNAEVEFAEIMKEEKINSWDMLQRVIWKMEMGGKEDTAVRVLKERYNKEMKEENDYEAYELGLLLVEMMIYQGHYRPARTICLSLLKDRPKDDARPSLYLAVTNALLGAKKEAERNWKDFTIIQGSGGRGAESTGCSPEKESNLTFAQFADHMETLEREIALG